MVFCSLPMYERLRKSLLRRCQECGSAYTVTITTTASGVYTYGFILEYGGLSGSVDKTSTGSGASGNPHVTSFSPSLGTAVFGIAAGPTGWTAGTGYIMIGSRTGVECSN